MTELENRGVQDILIAVVDGFKSFPGAIIAAFSDTVVQNEGTALYQFEQKPLCRASISPRLKDFLKNEAVLINRAPQPNCHSTSLKVNRHRIATD
ncbi:transposase [Sulfitobacter sp. NFXS29]